MSTLSKSKKIVIGGVIAIALAILAIKTFFVGFYRIPQNGMYPGLPAGSRVLAVRQAYSDASSVKRGDIVVFIREENGQRYHIWRVIGLPGELVMASGESLSINGRPVQRQRIREADGKIVYREQISEASYEVALETSPSHTPPDIAVTIPAGQFFVMGDNRFDARDSRYFGPVAFASIVGKKL